jgi:SAM-dependent methyltransferase
MSDYTASTYGDRIAEVYDNWYTLPINTGDAVDFLASVARKGPALELGIGTGRIAIPLRERGIEVHGIDASRAMIAKLRAKPGGRRIRVKVGDFGGELPEGRFSLIYVAFNTLFALLTQDDQVRCFQNVARRLTRNGSFVIEAFVPDLARFDRSQRVGTIALDSERVVLEVTQTDQNAQRTRSQHVVISPDGVRMYPVQIRYAWPSELDLMARIAGMRLRERWGGWRREPFGPGSQHHVSVYQRAVARGATRGVRRTANESGSRRRRPRSPSRQG